MCELLSVILLCPVWALVRRKKQCHGRSGPCPRGAKSFFMGKTHMSFFMGKTHTHANLKKECVPEWHHLEFKAVFDQMIGLGL